jgi:ribosome production factor 2
MIEEKPKHPRALRVWRNRQPKEFENVKRAMFIKGSKSSFVVTCVLKDLAALKKPDIVKYNNKKRNKYPSPFEDETTVEFLSTKSDCSLFMFGSHSKKRPHNLVIGRTFNYHILDMIELGITQFKPMEAFNKRKNAVGSKPCFIISGAEFENNEELKMTANIIVDFFRGRVVDAVNLAGIDHVIALTAINATSFHFRHYSIQYKKSGEKVPKVELEEIGPSLDFTLRRNKFSLGEIRKQTLPRKIKKKKNLKTNELREYVSNVHLPNQKIAEINKTVKRTKALKRKWIRDTNEENPTENIDENVDSDNEVKSQKKKRRLNDDI